ncbi:hypothetical protein BC628DRAFT_1021562 [Trametes gibbosa]|nr:hypothetical protein BC628DRAFT_1021562 [Trametes gibbosa]
MTHIARWSSPPARLPPPAPCVGFVPPALPAFYLNVSVLSPFHVSLARSTYRRSPATPPSATSPAPRGPLTPTSLPAAGSQAYHRVSRPSRACGRSSRSHSAHHIPPAALLMSQARSPHPRAARALPDGCAVTNRPESYRSSLQLGSRAGPPSVPSPREQCALVGASHTHLLPPSPDPSAGATTQYRVSRTHRRRCTGVRLSLTSALTTFACVRWHSAAFSG